MRRGTPESLRRGEGAQPHAGRVDHVFRLQVATCGDGCVTHRDAADLVALALNRVAAFAADGPGYARAENQIVVSGVDYRVRFHFRQVALLDHDFLCRGFRALLAHCRFRITPGPRQISATSATRSQQRLLCPSGGPPPCTRQPFLATSAEREPALKYSFPRQTAKIAFRCSALGRTSPKPCPRSTRKTSCSRKSHSI